jgi:hypothetical protein
MDPITIVLILWLLLPFLFLFLWLRERSKGKKVEAARTVAVSAQQALETRYAKIISVDDEVAKLRTTATDLEANLVELRKTYVEKRAILQKLEAQVAVYDERLSFAELGVYEPHFDFSDSETYKTAISAVRERQKDMVSSKTATICPADWTVDGSKSKGQAMVNRQTRLTMRAFNNECEAAIANTRWNNVNAMEKRIQTAAKQINSANESMRLTISDKYVALKLEELYLTHEYRERLKAEKEERAEMARAEREEKKLIADNSYWRKPGPKPASTRQRSLSCRRHWMTLMPKRNVLGRWQK